MRFHPLLMLAVMPAFLLVSCAETAHPDNHTADVNSANTWVEDDYHATGNCAMGFSAADSALRAAKHAEPGVKMVELSNGCVCCSASDEMLKGIDWLIQRNGDAEPFDHIVVECSGVAEPSGVREKFQDAEMEGAMELQRCA